MEGVIVRILANIREAWTQVIDLRPRFAQIETNPQFAQIVPPTEMVVLITLERNFLHSIGFLQLERILRLNTWKLLNSSSHLWIWM